MDKDSCAVSCVVDPCVELCDYNYANGMVCVWSSLGEFYVCLQICVSMQQLQHWGLPQLLPLDLVQLQVQALAQDWRELAKEKRESRVYSCFISPKYV